MIIGRKERRHYHERPQHLAPGIWSTSSKNLPEIRSGDACAFSIQGSDQSEMAVMVVQCRELNTAKHADFIHRLQGLIREHFCARMFR